MPSAALGREKGCSLAKSDAVTILDVIDLPQLHQQPCAEVLLATLRGLLSTPPSWERRRCARIPQQAGVRVRGEGLPHYLTTIVSSRLAWLPNDDVREQVWEEAAQRLSERSGRMAMSDLTRTFSIPFPSLATASKVRAQAGLSSQQIDIILHEPALTADNLGFKTWASSYLLAKRLSLLRSSYPPANTPILELGAGTGLVGIAAAAIFQAHVVLTDLPAIVPNIARNIAANAAALAMHNGSAHAAVLDWSCPASFSYDRSNPAAFDGFAPLHDSRTDVECNDAAGRSFSLILAADPIYCASHPPLFVQAVRHHLSTSRDARLVLAVPLREGFGRERADLRRRLEALRLEVIEQGEDVGKDDWSGDAAGEFVDTEEEDEEEEEGEMNVRCWWSVWSWRPETEQEVQDKIMASDMDS